MKLTVSKEAAQWFIKELDLKENDSIQFFGKVYGPHGGFSIAIEKQPANKAAVTTMVEGINFYIETVDSWFFDNADLEVSYNEKLKEPHYELINH